ncbi:hypothetical protein EJ05DRAFT_496734 [Pseudovirgaria hyperparasitica]|uniref:ABM domain-containing protein n=1 Tax=Pseudovirgaria hyperparasitica TaxID=470096 RepID=A0A6A6WIE8_9PEZI|nr:uncharacterized protein EJ05DRAFT_496734 [Pseudovirgaria hyperparasitica]KAF2761844.1 hypothetical protein EJ05DRAFT_496734 [Pseudovirgaria hyperparasitica]
MAASAPASGVSRHITVYIKPEHASTFLGAFKTLFDQVVTNPECKLFEVYRDSKEPGVFHWVEDWDGTAEWLAAAQEGSEDYKKWLAFEETLYAKPREERIVERMAGDFFHVNKA